MTRRLFFFPLPFVFSLFETRLELYASSRRNVRPECARNRETAPPPLVPAAAAASLARVLCRDTYDPGADPLRPTRTTTGNSVCTKRWSSRGTYDVLRDAIRRRRRRRREERLNVTWTDCIGNEFRVRKGENYVVVQRATTIDVEIFIRADGVLSHGTFIRTRICTYNSKYDFHV